MPTRKHTEVDTPEAQDILGDELDDEDTEEEATSRVKVKHQNASRVIKYMGSADNKILNPGETLLGNVEDDDAPNEPLVWTARGGTFVTTDGKSLNSSEGHLLVTDEHPEVSDKFWDELVKVPDFKDVTEAFNDPNRRVPKNTYDVTWRHRSDRTGGI